MSDPDGKFAISGASLITKASLDYENATSHLVTINASNGSDRPLTRTFVVAVTNEFEDEDLKELSLPCTVTPGTAIGISGTTLGSTIEALVLPSGWTFDADSQQIIISSDAEIGLQNWVLLEARDDSRNSPRITEGSTTVEAQGNLAPTPSADWNGIPGSGFSSAPTDPARSTAKPVLHLIEPPRQRFTTTLTVGAMAMANNNGSLIGGVSSVRFYFENEVPVEVATPTFRTLTREDGSTYSCLGYWVDLQRPIGIEGEALLYIEALPADATMQRRVIGPFSFFPALSAYDFQATIGANGKNYTTITDAIAGARSAGANHPRFVLTDNGDYTVASGGPAYVPDGYIKFESEDGVTARLTLARGKEGAWDPNVGRFWFEGLSIDLDTIASIKTQGDAGHVLRRCRAERAGGRQLWFKNTPPDSHFVEGPTYLLECYTDGVYEVGDANALMRGNVNQRGFGDITDGCPATLYNTFHDWDWLDIAPTDIPRMTIRYHGDGSSVTLARSFQRSGPQTNRYRVFDLKVDGQTVLIFEAWQFWDRFAEPVTFSGGSPLRVRGYEVQHFVDAVNSLPDFAASLENNEVAARALNLQGSTDNADFADTQIISGKGSYDLIADIDLHGGGISGKSGENRFHLFDRFTDFNVDLLWNYSQNPGYNDVIIAGCILDQGGDELVGTNNLIANSYSHVVFVHNSVRGQRVFLGETDGSTTWDGYCLFSNNAAPTLGDNSSNNHLVGANNHVELGTILSPSFTGTIVSGSTATWYPDANTRNFAPSGELAANPKPPTMTYDSEGRIRSNPSVVGA
ncbi:MAG: hypothetical protein AAF251_06260 [Pseudomonadota bacterium]